MKGNMLILSLTLYSLIFMLSLADFLIFEISYSLIIDFIILISAIGTIIRKNDYFRLDLVFVILFPFYFKISFFFNYWFDLSIFDLTDEVFMRSYLICQVSWLLMYIFYMLRPSAVIFDNHCNNVLQYFQPGASLSKLYVPFFISFIVSVFFLRQIYPLLDSDVSNLSRLEITELVGYSGWYLKYVIIGYGFFLICKIPHAIEGRKYIQLFILSLPILIYFFYQIFLGGRRELISMILFSIAFYIVYNKGRVGKFFYSSIVLLFTLFITLGVLRDFSQENFIKIVTDALGEFIFPISTLQVNVSETSDMKLGISYFYSFTNFIPSVIFPDKPMPLAVQFALNVADPSQEYILGYAITPITESYVNFGIASVFLLPIFISVLSFIVEYISNFIKPAAIVFFSQSLNFQRSDLSSLAFEFAVLLVVITLLKFLSRGSITDGFVLVKNEKC